MKTRGQFLGLLKKARKRSSCLVENCQLRPVRCHSVSVSAGLKPLSRDGKIYCLDAHPMVLKKRAGAPDVRLDGIRRASTFYGFCQPHDSKLFRVIDEREFSFEHLQTALLLIRALAHEISKKEMSFALADFVRNTVGDFEWASDIEIGTQWSMTAMQHQLDLLQDAIEGPNLETVRFTAFVSDAPPPLASSMVWFPDYDFEAKPIQRLPQGDHTPGLVGIFSMPWREGSICLVAWHEESEWCAQRLLSSLARTRSPDEFGDGLLQLQMAVAENVYFMPDWWDGLPDSTKEQYFDWWRRQADANQPPEPDQSDRLRLTGLEWPVHSVQTG